MSRFHVAPVNRRLSPSDGGIPDLDASGLIDEEVHDDDEAFDDVDDEKERHQLWSFNPPRKYRTPATDFSNWPRTKVDTFVLQQLKNAGIKPSADTSRATLIRRLSYDLRGLPPTPEEVKSFQADARPDVYHRLVERYLADENFGVAWGQYWLDVVRYDDTNGFEKDDFRPNAWRYRDYVVKAFNTDKPYDQFLREQIAGDELILGPNDPDRAEKWIATGFLRLGSWDSTADIFGREDRSRDQLLADVVETTSAAFLGMTLSCARCHDHKYDPIPQTDYYRLQAFFAGVKFRDDVIIDSPHERKLIDHLNRKIDADLTLLRQQQQELLAPVRLRAIEARKALFPPDILRDLQIPEPARSPAVQRRLEPYLARIQFSDSDLAEVLSPTLKGEYKSLAGQIANLRIQRKPHARAMAMSDYAQKIPPTFRLDQGDYRHPLEEVHPGFLSAIGSLDIHIDTEQGRSTSGRRKALAEWIASADNPLTARVMVNRVWQKLLGRGLVETPNDFGSQGTEPTHPELLDRLAIEFVENNWSVKHLVRTIVMSSVYRQQSATNPVATKVDPHNRLFWRQNVKRLDAENLRDSMLMVSGRLDERFSGPPVWPALEKKMILERPAVLEWVNKAHEGRLQGWYADPPGSDNVRSLFLIQKRTVPLPFLQVFDLPERTLSCGRRNQTTVAPQALALLNSPFSSRTALLLARRLRSEGHQEAPHQIRRLYSIALSREPDAEEMKLCLSLLATHEAQHRQLNEPLLVSTRKQYLRKARGQQTQMTAPQTPLKQSLRQVTSKKCWTPEFPTDDSRPWLKRQPLPLEQPHNAQEAALTDLCRLVFNLNEFVYID